MTQPDPDKIDPMTAQLDNRTVELFIQQGRTQWAARLAGPEFTDWLLSLANIAEPSDPAGWLCGAVVLNEDCWFDYFAQGFTPADCWREECSYD